MDQLFADELAHVAKRLVSIRTGSGDIRVWFCLARLGDSLAVNAAVLN